MFYFTTSWVNFLEKTTFRLNLRFKFHWVTYCLLFWSCQEKVTANERPIWAKGHATRREGEEERRGEDNLSRREGEGRSLHFLLMALICRRQTVGTAPKTIHWYIPRRDWKPLKGCVFSPPSLRLVPTRGREARKCNLSIASLPTPLYKQF